MSNTLIRARLTYPLAGLGTAPDSDTVSELLAAGYDQGSINLAIQLGATNEQLQALPYPTDAGTEANAISALIDQLQLAGTSVQRTAQGALLQIPGYGAANISLPWPLQSTLLPQFSNIVVIGGGVLLLLVVVGIVRKI
jgi:hypothetical protein